MLPKPCRNMCFLLLVCQASFTVIIVMSLWTNSLRRLSQTGQVKCTLLVVGHVIHNHKDWSNKLTTLLKGWSVQKLLKVTLNPHLGLTGFHTLSVSELVLKFVEITFRMYPCLFIDTLNTQVHEATKHTPNELVFGHPPRLLLVPDAGFHGQLEEVLQSTSSDDVSIY